MSRAHDGQQRSVFPFGNPFRAGRARSSLLSAKLDKIQKIFEESLAMNLMKLKPEVGADIPSFSWMRNAMDFLSILHDSLNTLIEDLEFPVSNWEQQWIDLYLDDSIKLLDVCNAFSSELSRYEQCQLMLRCVLHMLDQVDGAPSEGQLKKAHGYLMEWRQQLNSRNTKLETSATILKELSGSLHVANFKKSAKGKVLMRAMYAIKVVTIFVCCILSAALTSSSQLLIDFHIPEEFPWAQAFNGLQSDVNREIRKKLSCRRVAALNEMVAVGQCVDELFFVTSNSILQMHSASQMSTTCEHAEHKDLQTTNLVKDDMVKVMQDISSHLEENMEILSYGLDSLSKEVREFFQMVMKGRDALLNNLRISQFGGADKRKL